MKTNTLHIVEDHEEVINYQFLKRSTQRYMLFYTLGTVSMGMIFLFFHWIKGLDRMLYEKVDKFEQATHVLFESKQGNEICEIYQETHRINPLTKPSEIRFVIYACSKYGFSNGFFRNISNDFFKEIQQRKSFDELDPLNEEDIEQLQKFFGPNQIKIKPPSLFILLIKKFFIFVNMIELVVGIADIYYEKLLYPTLLIMFIINQTLFGMWEEISKVRKINKLSEKHFIVKVARFINHQVETISIDSRELVVGDMVILESDMELTCDVLLLEGNCLVSEAVLTGESVPVAKEAVNEGDIPDSNNYVLNGSHCMMLRSDFVRGVVVKTAWSTYKGSLVGMLMYPNYLEFKFNKDFVKVTLFMTLIFLFIFVGLIRIDIMNDNFSIEGTILRFSELVICAIQPSVLFTYYFLHYLIMKRMSNKKVSCLLSDKIQEAGRIKHICFDKTGTLTENNLQIKGYVTTEEGCFTEPVKEMWLLKNLDHFKAYMEALACCHSLHIYKGKIIGDPIEEQMFQKTQFSYFADTENGGYSIAPATNFLKKFKLPKDFTYKIEKTISFNSERKRMSTIVRTADNYRILSKGAPEILKLLCESESLPANYDEKLHFYSEQGFRVFAIAYKDIKDNEFKQEVKDLENNLTFAGFLLIHNPIKKETREIITTLMKNDIVTGMITGDNVFTAINVGVQANILKSDTDVWVGEFKKGDISWNFFKGKKPFDIDEMYNSKKNIPNIHQSSILPEDALNESVITKQTEMKLVGSECVTGLLTKIKRSEGKIKMVLDGNSLEHLFECYGGDQKLIYDLLEQTVIYGRTKPHQKEMIVKELQKMYASDYLTVGFVGDGANDCKALSSANLGLSVGNSESSITASFSTKEPHIGPVLDVIIQGKFLLETNIQLYKIGIVGNILAIIAIYLIGTYNLNFSNFQYAVSNLPWLPCLILMCLTQARGMNRFRPLPGLLNTKTMSSILACLFLCILIQYLWITGSSKRSFFKSTKNIFHTTKIDFEKINHPEVIISFILIRCCEITSQVAMNQGFPFKKNILSNKTFIIYITFILTFFMSMVYNEFFEAFPFNIAFAKYMNIPKLNSEYRTTFLIFICIVYFFEFFVEKVIQYWFFKKEMMEFTPKKEGDYSHIEGIVIKPIIE